MVGRYIDRTNKKMGRNRPWITCRNSGSCCRYGTGVYHAGFLRDGEAGMGVCHLYSVFIWLYDGKYPNDLHRAIPWPNPAERTNITTVKAICSSLGSLTSASLAAFLLVRLSGGNAATGYLRTNLLFALVVIIVLLISVFSIQEINPPAVHAEDRYLN